MMQREEFWAAFETFARVMKRGASPESLEIAAQIVETCDMDGARLRFFKEITALTADTDPRVVADWLKTGRAFAAMKDMNEAPDSTPVEDDVVKPIRQVKRKL